MSDSLAVIGFGSMGSALVAGALRSNLFSPTSILVLDPDPLARLRAAALGCTVTDDPSTLSNASWIALAVKPQTFPELALNIGALQPNTLVVSVMAGVSIARLQEAFCDDLRCVRCMPNIAAQIGLAVTTYTCSNQCSDSDRDLVLRLLGTMGTTVEIAENMFDAATATSGSGPAYLFMLAESMIESAMRLGFDRPTADRLVRQALLGAATLLARGERTPSDLRAMVTSQGGTTSAAMAIFETHGFHTMMHDALCAARDRGRELSAAAAKQVPQTAGASTGK